MPIDTFSVKSGVGKKASEVRRLLSPVERWLWIVHQISPMNGFAWVQVRGKINPKQLTWAVAALVAEQPLLRVSIHAGADGSDPQYEPATDPVMPIRIVHAEADDEHAAEREIENIEMVEPVDTSTAPMARLVDVTRAAGTDAETHDLILTMSHVIVDATARVMMLGQLLRYAAEWDPNSDNPPQVISRDPVPPLGYLLPRGARSMGWAVAGMFGERMASLLARVKRLTPERDVPLSETHTRLLRRHLSADQLEALLTACRRKGVTAHAALATAVARAVGREIGIQKGKVAIRTPVEVRAELSPQLNKSEVGNYVCITNTYSKVDSDIDFWTVARQFNKSLTRRLRLRLHLSTISIMRAVAPKSLATSGRFIDGIDKRGSGNVLVSNLGRVNFPDRVGDWEVSAVQFFSMLSITAQIAFGVVTSNGMLHFNVCYIAERMSAERAARITDDALAILMTAIRPWLPE